MFFSDIIYFKVADLLWYVNNNNNNTSKYFANKMLDKDLLWNTLFKWFLWLIQLINCHVIYLINLKMYSTESPSFFLSVILIRVGK